MKAKLWAVIVLTQLLVACSAGSASYSKSAALEQGKQSFKTGNYAAAYHELLPLAARGNPDAQYAIGYMYYYGKGVDQNKQLARHWLSRAASQGQPNAQAALDQMS